MNRFMLVSITCLLSAAALGGEKTIVSLRDFSTTEVKYAGIELQRTMTVHIRARGAGGSRCDSERQGADDMFAYGWILDAERREVVWKMDRSNTSRSRDDRTFDGEITLPKGAYEVYFAAATFTYSSTFKNFSMNIDHRESGLFNAGIYSGNRAFGWFEKLINRWLGDDLREEWTKRSPEWGIDIAVDEANASAVSLFRPPKEFRAVLFKATGVGENVHIRQSFAVREPMTVRVYALGEGLRGEYDLADYAWIIQSANRSRVWEMKWKNSLHAGGASKNIKFDGTVLLPRGEYTLFYVTDNSHSAADWNCAPPADPLNYGITLCAVAEHEQARFALLPTTKDGPVILSLTPMHNNETRNQSFVLHKDASVRVYAIGERSNQRRSMADYGVILDARTRTKVWTMDVDRTAHAGGASKNRLIDEVVTLPHGTYVVQYVTDDSHAYGDWNADPPFDPEHYGITLYGASEGFDPSIVAKVENQRERFAIAQLIRVGSSEERQTSFKLEKTTRVRIYALGEGVNREMTDYGWITDNKTGATIWEMTYSMTMHAGGARKNRLVNTTIVLDKGEYTLHYATDDSHAYGDWNSAPPEDAEYWGITLYPDEDAPPPVPPTPPKP